MSRFKSIFYVLIFSVSSFACFATDTEGFYVDWSFVNSDGSDARAHEYVCQGSKVYLLNRSRYFHCEDQYHPEGYPIGNQLTGTYRISYGSGTSIFLQEVEATDWNGGEVVEIQLPSTLVLSAGALNFHVYYQGSDVSGPYTYCPGTFPGNSWRDRSYYLTTKANPVVDGGQDVAVCAGQPIQMNATANPTGTQINWTQAGSSATFNNGVYFNPYVNTVYTVSGSYSHYINSSLTITCYSSPDSKLIYAIPLPEINLNFNQLICSENDFPILVGPDNMLSYSWKNIDEVVLSTDQTFDTGLYGEGSYSLTVSGSNDSYNIPVLSPSECQNTEYVSVFYDESAAVNLNPDFTLNTSVVTSGNNVIISAAAQANSGEQHRWLLYKSNTNDDLLNLLQTSPWSASTTYSFSPVPKANFYRIVHEIKKAPCNTVNSKGVTTYMSQLILHGDGEIKIHPNPSKGRFNFETGGEHLGGRIDIYNHMNVKIASTPIEAQNVSINLSGFERGLYIAQIHSNNSVITKQIILE